MSGTEKKKYKNEKESALKDNIQICFKGNDREECRTAWSKDGRKKFIPQLQARLIEIIKNTKDKPIPPKPRSRVPQRKNTAVVGILCAKVNELDCKAMEENTEFDLNARKEWKKKNEQGIGSINAEIQEVGQVKLDNSFIGV